MRTWDPSGLDAANLRYELQRASRQIVPFFNRWQGRFGESTSLLLSIDPDVAWEHVAGLASVADDVFERIEVIIDGTAPIRIHGDESPDMSSITSGAPGCRDVWEAESILFIAATRLEWRVYRIQGDRDTLLATIDYAAGRDGAMRELSIVADEYVRRRAAYEKPTDANIESLLSIPISLLIDVVGGLRSSELGRSYFREVVISVPGR